MEISNVELQVNEHWPLISTVKSNGFAGIQITPRWASNIYYNVSSEPPCIVVDSNQLDSVIWQTVPWQNGLQLLRERAIFLRY